MKKVKALRLLFLFVAVFVAGSVVINAKKSYAKDWVAYYDNLFASGEYTLYTDAVSDTSSLYNVLNSYYDIQRYSLPQGKYMKITPSNCDYNSRTCTFVLNSYSSEIKRYENIKIIIESNIANDFSMVNGTTMTINYDESMFMSDYEKQTYISNYVSSLSHGIDGEYSRYKYVEGLKLLIREDVEGNDDSNIVKYLAKKVDNIVFKLVEEPYSDQFKRIAQDGILKIKTDSSASTIPKYILEQYLSSMNGAFALDGEINFNKAIIKLTKWGNGQQFAQEKHLVTLVKDSDNFDINLFKKVGYDGDINIKADAPTDADTYLNNYFNNTNFYTCNKGECEDFIDTFINGANPIIGLVKYEKRGTDNGNILDVQIHQANVNFVGYSDIYSDNFKKTVGDEITIRADKLDFNTIQSDMASRPYVDALGCNSDYSICDIALNDNSGDVEIHPVKMKLDDSVSNVFAKEFNIKSDGTIDIITDDDLVVGYGYVYGYRYDDNGNSFRYECWFNDGKCSLTLQNFSATSHMAETHEVRFNTVNSTPSSLFASNVLSSVDVYPGERKNIWDQLSYRGSFRANNDYSVDVRIVGCDKTKGKCSVALVNNNKTLEVHNTNVSIKDGKSPEYSAIIPTDRLSFNSIYIDNADYIYDASRAYFLSKTKSYTYLNNFRDGKAIVEYAGLETHTVDVDFVQGNPDHKAAVDNVLNDMNNSSLKFVIEDLEYLNSFYYEDSSAYYASGFYNSKEVNDYLANIINNKHISYFLVDIGGAGDWFMEELGCKVVLYYDGIAYGETDSNAIITKRYVIYIPDDTPDTKEAFIAAAQKRVDEYLGDDSGVVISYSGKFDKEEGTDPEMLLYGYDLTGFDGNYYHISHKDKDRDIVILKNSAKMQTSTFNASDVNNNINVSSSNANYPINTVVSSEILDENSEEGQALMRRLGLEEAQIVDIDLYSPTVGDITNFDGVSFNVSVPIDEEKLGDGDLYAYYVADDGRVEEHPVERDDIMGTFGADHFSTYVIAAKVDDSLLNKIETPKTLDNILKWAVIGGTSIVLIVGGVMFAKNRKRKMNI